MRLFKTLIKDILGVFYYACYRVFTREREAVRVLMYHSVSGELPDDPYGLSIKPDLFRRQMELLKSRYCVVALDEVQSAGSAALCITFDDGFKDNLSAAALLTELGLPFTIYVATSFIDRPGYLSREDLRDLAQNPLCTLASHSHSHVALAHNANVEFELTESKRLLEEITGRRIVHFSFPYGSYTAQVRDQALRHYQTLGTSTYGLNPRSPAQRLLKRSEVLASDSLWRFKMKLRGYHDFLSYGAQ